MSDVLVNLGASRFDLSVCFSNDQVYELPKENPAAKLAEFLEHLKTLTEDGDSLATEIRSRLRLIV